MKILKSAAIIATTYFIIFLSAIVYPDIVVFSDGGFFLMKLITIPLFISTDRLDEEEDK